MRRPALLLTAAGVVLLLAALALLVSPGFSATAQAQTSTNPSLKLNAPQRVDVGEPIDITLSVSNVTDIAGYETNLLFDTSVAELNGLSQREYDLTGSGRDAGPLGVVETPQGISFGAFSCPVEDCVDWKGPKTKNGKHGDVKLSEVSITPNQPGSLEIKLDATKFVDAAGNPVSVDLGGGKIVVQVVDEAAGTGPSYSAPTAVPWKLASRSSSRPGPFDLTKDGQVTYADAAEGSLAWTRLRESNQACGKSVGASQDVNHDGCIDVADLQMIAANYSASATSGAQASTESGKTNLATIAAVSSLIDWMAPRAALAAENSTFTVNSGADNADAKAGDGTCATTSGACTLRAAIEEANLHSGPDTIAFNIPGSGVQTIQLGSQLPNLNDQTGPTTIDGYTQPGSAPNTDPSVSKAKIGVQIAGGGESNFDGLYIASSGNVIRGLAFFKLKKALRVYGKGARNNAIVGDFVGTDAAGSYAASTQASGANGIMVQQGATNNHVGGTSAAERNVISGGALVGIELYDEGTDSNVFVNNMIGLSPGGDRRLPNQWHGIDVNVQAAYNVFGGTQPGERNVITGNFGEGIEISHNPATTQNQVIGNFIGTDVTGKSASTSIRNSGGGVHLEDGVTNNTIADNVIGNNKAGGIHVEGFYTNDNQIRNNRIGVSLDGKNVTNNTWGIRVDFHASKTQIGPGNTIGYNSDGIRILGADVDSNTITRNSIFGNTGFGIDLEPIGYVTYNDAGDADSGPNEQLNFPVLKSATQEKVTGTVCGACTVEVFLADEGAAKYGEGKTFVGSSTANSDGTFAVAVSGVASGDYVTATATDAAGNTSEFSLNKLVSDTTPPETTIDSGPSATVNSGSASFAFSSSESGSTFECRLDGASFGSCTSPKDYANLSDGSHTFEVRAKDAAGNTDASPASRTWTVDATAPTVASVAPADGATAAALDVNVEATFSEKMDASTLTGSTFTLTKKEGSSTPVQAEVSYDAAAKKAVLNPASDLDQDVTYTATIKGGSSGAKDAVGNPLTADKRWSFKTPDTKPPGAPTVDLASESDTGASDADDITSDSTPTFGGTAEANSTVKIYDGNTLLGTAMTDGSGSWSFTPGNSLGDGTHSITATATDAAGNASPYSTAISVTVDTAAPSAPSVTSPADGTTTNDNTPTFSGIAAGASSTVEVFDGSTSLGTMATDGAGNWSFTPSTGLSDATRSITATATDAAGNTSSASTAISITVDTAAPSAPAITSPSDGTTTNDATPAFGGTAEAGSTVEIFDGSTSLGTATADSSGNWSFTPGSSLTDGAHSITATAEDAAGNTSPASTAVSVTIDATSPSAPAITSPSDGSTTNDATPTFGGTAEASSTVEIFDGNTPLGTTTADSSGNWSFTPSSSVADGTHSITVTATDGAGNTSSASTAISVTIDTAAPSAPSISSPADGTTTNDDTPTFGGTAEADSTVEVFDGSTSLGTATADSSGNWSFTPSTGLSDGTHSITATATDEAGNASSASTAISVTIDTAAPSAPAVTSPSDGSTTNDNTPTFGGTAETGGSVEIFDGSTSLGTTTADGSGSWSFTPSSSLNDGTRSITATAKDAAGNTSASSTAISVSIDTSAPSAPAITSPGDGRATNDATPTFSGTAEADSAVELFDGGTSLGTATADSSGNWSFTPSSSLADGAHSITATATDDAGNVSSASAAITVPVDTAAPGAPEITSPSDGAITNDATPTFSGIAEADSTVELFDDSTSLGTTTADGSGSWSFTPSTGLTEGTHSITATATDAAGNASSASTAVSVTIDTAAPSAPEITSPSDGSAINDAKPAFGGTAEAGSTVEVFDGGTSLGTTTTDSSGDWSFTPSSSLSDGAHSITATATDEAGNASSASTAVSVSIDTEVPDTTITSGPSSPASDNTPTFEFESSETGGTFECRLTKTGDTPGAFESCASPQEYGPLATDGGEYTFEVRAVDGAGNTDATPASHTLTVDTAAPTVSSVLPASQASDVAVTDSVEATFSEAMDASTLTDSTFTLTKQGATTPVAATVSYDGAAKKAVLDPAEDLEAGVTYTATVKGGTSGAKDSAGNPLGADEVWSFTTVAQKTREALSFDGIDDRGSVPNFGWLNLAESSARTYELWMKTGPDVDARQFVYEEGGEHNGFSMEIAGGRLYFNAWSHTNGWITVHADAPVSPNTTYRVAGVYDGASGEVRLYLDGVLKGVSSGAGAVMYRHADGVALGGVNGTTRDHARTRVGSGSNFKGWIGEFRAWDHARAQDSIEGEMEADLTGSEGGLILLYAFDEGSGAVLNDSGPNNLDGTIYGATWDTITYTPPSRN